MTHSLSSAVRKFENLERSWRVIASNGRASKSDAVRLELEAFAEDPTGKLRSIQSRLGRSSFVFPPAKGVPIPKIDTHGKNTGKFRPIVLAPVESRIVQRAILNVLVNIDGLKPYTETPFSFGGIRRAPFKKTSEMIPRADRVSAVPAAIKCVLSQIEGGGRFVACADIRQFFTRISKTDVTSIVTSVVDDVEFIKLFNSAIDVELSNLAALRQKSALFPIEDIGVAQGNSLSPLLGNIALAEFDRRMNEGDCRCIRYIDDFIIIAPTEKAANARLRLSKELLSKLGMELSPEKSSTGGAPISDGFDFLGINICPGVIRPTSNAQARFLASIDEVFDAGAKSMRGAANGTTFDRSRSLIGTLKRIDGMIEGWGKHYWFCNDKPTMKSVDERIAERVRKFLGEYRSIRNSVTTDKYTALLGLPELMKIKGEPFAYPKGC